MDVLVYFEAVAWSQLPGTGLGIDWGGGGGGRRVRDVLVRMQGRAANGGVTTAMMTRPLGGRLVYTFCWCIRVYQYTAVARRVTEMLLGGSVVIRRWCLRA